MAQENAVDIVNLQVRFGNRVILPNLSMSIHAGQIIGLLGPSGSGKSTLVKSIIGTNPFQSGTVTIFGKCVPSLDIMTEIGYMAQSDALYDDLSAAENLVFFARLFGIRENEAKKRANDLLDFVGLGDSRKKSVKHFSGGMKRRLSLAISLINHPRLLILDEPTVGVDPVLRKKFWTGFESLRAKGCTILATTHVMDEVKHCDRLFLLREGKIIASGTLAELLCQTGTQNMEDAFLRFSETDEKEAN